MTKANAPIALFMLGLLCAWPAGQRACAADDPVKAEDITLEAAAPPKARVPATRTPKRALINSGRMPAAQIETEPIMAPGLVRLKDIADVQGVRGNQLVGYGLVTGLEGTGDGQSSTFTPQSLVNMLRKFGLNLTVDQAKSKKHRRRCHYRRPSRVCQRGQQNRHHGNVHRGREIAAGRAVDTDAASGCGWRGVRRSAGSRLHRRLQL